MMRETQRGQPCEGLCAAATVLELQPCDACSLIQADGDSTMAEDSSSTAAASTEASADTPVHAASSQPLIPEVELYAYLLTLLLFTDQQKYELVRSGLEGFE